MSRWSNQFASLGWLILLAACSSTPREDSQAPASHAVKRGADGTVKAEGRPADASVPGNSAAPNGSAASSKAMPSSNAPAAGVAADPAPVPAPAEEQYATALALMKNGQVADAEMQFKRMAAVYPEFAGPQLNLGLIYLQDSRLPDAEAVFKAVLERNPSNAIAGNELGIVERRLGKFTEAEGAYQRTIAAEPNYAPAYLNLGVLYDLYLAEPRKALDQFEHYLQLAGENKQVAGWVVELRKRVGAPPSASKKEPA